MTVNQYVKEVIKRLSLPKGIRKRIEQDLLQDINAAVEKGESLEQIIARMGPPEEVSREFNESYAEEIPPLNRKQRIVKVLLTIILVLGCVCLLLNLIPIMWQGYMSWQLGHAGSIGIIGGADGPTAIFVTSAFTPFSIIRGIGIPLFMVLIPSFFLWRQKRKHGK